MDAQTILKKIEILPENLQLQIVDYIDFLITKYLKTEKQNLQNETDFILTDDIKKILDYRIAHHEKNKHKAKSAEEVLNEMAKKYNYEL